MVRIGIIGTDTITHLHTSGLLTNTNYEIAGCYAPDNRESMIFARQYRLVSYSSLDALFKYTDAIDIAGYFPGIMSIAEMSLKKMKHVFIAQPYHLSIGEIQYLIKIANESGAALQFGAGYRYCPAYYSLIELKQKPRVIDIRHQLLDDHSDLLTQLTQQLSCDLDFVLGIVQANFRKIELKSWSKTEGYPPLLECRMECDNSCVVNIEMHTVSEGEPQLEVTCDLSDIEVRTDIFNSAIEKKYMDYDVTDSIVLDAYNEKNIYKQELTNFFMAINNDTDALNRIEEQLQSIAATDMIIERIKQLQLISSL